MLNLNQINWCVDRVVEQLAPTEYVKGMCAAFFYAFDCTTLMDPENRYQYSQIFICRLAGLVLMQASGVQGYRTTPVHFADGSFAPSADLVPRLMNQLICYQNDLTPDEYYQEFERIHPIDDGNGRVGAILYNMLMGTMDDPIAPPVYTGKASISS